MARMKKIPIDDIKPNSWNPNSMAGEEFSRLKSSIELTGGIYFEDNPILVRPKNGYYEIVDGEHRWKAAKELGMTEICCEVKEISDERARELSVILNKDRGTINYFKLSKLLHDFYEPYSRDGMSQRELGEKFGYARATISRILLIYPHLKKCYHDNTSDKFSNRQLMEIARIKNDVLRELLFEKLSRRRTPISSKILQETATLFNQVTDNMELSDEKIREGFLEWWKVMTEASMFKLEGVYKLPSEGLKYFGAPPDIVGKHDHGEKKKLTFYFDTDEEVEEVRKFFRTGRSSVPDGRKLLRLTRSLKDNSIV